VPDQTLLLLLDEVRGKTLLILDATPAEFALWAPPGLENHILWCAGHSYVVVESLAMRAMGLQPEIPEGWCEMFSWESRPAQVSPDRWPTLPEVVDRLRVQHERLRVVIGGLSGEQLDRPSADNPARTVLYAIVHGLHDEAGHLGEAHLLLKMQAREGT
jgi:DinB superfamily